MPFGLSSRATSQTSSTTTLLSSSAEPLILPMRIRGKGGRPLSLHGEIEIECKSEGEAQMEEKRGEIRKEDKKERRFQKLAEEEKK